VPHIAAWSEEEATDIASDAFTLRENRFTGAL